MARVTIQLLEGLERGQVYFELPTPVTIGREDDNTIRLNDERVSRFHAKIQEDGGKVILTDLDSTNGTRVNGHPVQMRVLQIGDQLSIGRCLLVFGSREQISRRAEERWGDEGGREPHSLDNTVRAPRDRRADPLDSLDDPQDSSEYGSKAVAPPDSQEQFEELFPNGVPEPPGGLKPFQRAEISDLIAFAHEQIRTVLQSAYEDPENRKAENEMESMRVHWPAWQRLLKLEMDLAVTLRKLADPGS